MFKGLGDIASLMKQAQQMGGRMQGIADDLKARRATGSAGAGMVEIEVNGLGEVLACRLDPALVERRDREMLEDLIVGATNQALAKAKQLHAEAMKSLAGGINLPGLDDALARLIGGGPPSPDTLD